MWWCRGVPPQLKKAQCVSICGKPFSSSLGKRAQWLASSLWRHPLQPDELFLGVNVSPWAQSSQWGTQPPSCTKYQLKVIAFSPLWNECNIRAGSTDTTPILLFLLSHCVVPFRVAMTNCRAPYSSLKFSKFSPSSQTPQLSREFCLPQKIHYKYLFCSVPTFQFSSSLRLTEKQDGVLSFSHRCRVCSLSARVSTGKSHCCRWLGVAGCVAHRHALLCS